jgi:AcrR family transcriptional regulator
VVRRDVERNRAAILDAARAIAGEFEELRMSTVAKRAGVGQGTLYRHFATRDDLLAALYAEEVDDLVAAAERLTAAHPASEALRLWLARLADYARVKRGVIEVAEAALWADISAGTHGRLGTALTTLLATGAAEGVVRDDVEPRDVVLLSWFLAHVVPEEWDQRVPRLLDVLLSGLGRPA